MKNSFHICTISREGKHNWEICKANGIWGIPSNGRKIGFQSPSTGDVLIFYQAGSGLIGFGRVSGSWITPNSKQEAPWAGGIFRYGKVVPFILERELETPIKVLFSSNKISGTGINLTMLRRGYAQISETDGEVLLKLIEKN